ncbi:MAG: hypothetical protein QOH41_2654 [Blastocatellia bacterium]|nr:hypothetical protein [Blastocatellia bacterium]
MKKNILLVSAVGLGAGFLYLFSRDARKAFLKQTRANGRAYGNGTSDTSAEQPRAAGRPAQSSRSSNGSRTENIVVDDQGTNQHEAAHIMKNIRDAAFDSSDEKLALALGRPVEEIEAWTRGSEIIDGDGLIKARALAMQRGVEID